MRWPRRSNDGITWNSVVAMLLAEITGLPSRPRMAVCTAIAIPQQPLERITGKPVRR